MSGPDGRGRASSYSRYVRVMKRNASFVLPKTSKLILNLFLFSPLDIISE